MIIHERFTLSDIDWPEFLFHMQRYALAQRFARGLQVLDCACGEGYGTAYIAQEAVHVTGLDISIEAITQCRETFIGVDNIDFQIADMAHIPFPEASFDLVVCFEAIEHIDADKQDRALAEMRRVLKPEGILLISTPDRLVGEKRGYANPFHVAEMTITEFSEKLGRHFPHVALYSQELNMVSAMWSLDTNGQSEGIGEWIDQTILEADRSLRPMAGNNAFYYVFAICSSNPITLPHAHYFSSYRREPAQQLWNRIDAAEQRLQQEVVELQRQLVAADERAANADQTASRLREQFLIAEKNNTMLAREIVALERNRAELGEVRQQLDATCAELGEVRQQLDATCAELGEVRQQFDATCAELGEVRQQLDAARDRLQVTEAFYGSRVGRLARRYYAIYDTPLIGAVMRAMRAVVRTLRPGHAR